MKSGFLKAYGFPGIMPPLPSCVLSALPTSFLHLINSIGEAPTAPLALGPHWDVKQNRTEGSPSPAEFISRGEGHTKSRVSAVYIISSDDKYYGGNKSGKGGLGRAGVRIGCNLRGWQKSSLGRWVAQ